MREKIPHCALMRRSGGCHNGHFGGVRGNPPPATQCWMSGWGGSRTPIKYHGGFPPPTGMDIIVGREPNHQQSGCYCGAGAEPPAILDVIVGREPNHQQCWMTGSRLCPRPPQPPRGGKATARRGPTHMPPRIWRLPSGCLKSKTLLNIMGHIISGNRNNIPIMSSRGFVVF